MVSKKIAILILNLNGERFLEDCYDSILGQTNKDFDTYLIDNNSSDKSLEVTKSYEWVDTIQTGENKGYTGAYNYAVKELLTRHRNYKHYLILNNDTTISPNFIETVLGVFSRYKNAGIVIPAVVDKDYKLDSLGGVYLMLTGTTLGNLNGQHYQRSNKVFECFWASGCALTIKSKIFIESGCYKDYFMYYEDVELSWRVNNLGYKVVATAEAYVIHIGGGTKMPSARQMYLSERNRLWCHYSNMPTLAFYFALLPFLTLRIGILLFKPKTKENIAESIRGLVSGIVGLKNQPKNIVTWKGFIHLMLNAGKVREVS